MSQGLPIFRRKLSNGVRTQSRTPRHTSSYDPLRIRIISRASTLPISDQRLITKWSPFSVEVHKAHKKSQSLRTKSKWHLWSLTYRTPPKQLRNLLDCQSVIKGSYPHWKGICFRKAFLRECNYTRIWRRKRADPLGVSPLWTGQKNCVMYFKRS